MKYGNRLVFMRDLEKHLEDLSYTKGEIITCFLIPTFVIYLWSDICAILV